MTVSLDTGDTRLIIAECHRQGLLRNQAAYALATAIWETAHTMRPVVEAYWKSEGWRAANLRYYPWHGRGYVQLTWERNYKKAARKLGVPLDKDPALALRPDIAVRVLVTGMREGWFTGKKLSDYITLTHSDFINARRIVNGTDKAASIAKLARQYDKALLAEGYGVDTSEPAPQPEPVPEVVVPPGIDKDMDKSKTGWAAILASILSAVMPVLTDWRVQMLLIVLIAAACAFIWFDRKKYRDKAREIIGEIVG